MSGKSAVPKVTTNVTESSSLPSQSQASKSNIEVKASANVGTESAILNVPAPKRSRKRKRGRSGAKKSLKVGKILEANEDNLETNNVKEVRYRGNLESNLWARRVCKERRTRLQEYLETLKGYESIEPEMYTIGRAYDKILSTLTTPMKISSYLDSQPEDSNSDADSL